jgi:alcohol dehydrogenase class IV
LRRLSAAAQRSVQDGLLAAVEADDMPVAVRRAAVAAAAHAAGMAFANAGDGAAGGRSE